MSLAALSLVIACGLSLVMSLAWLAVSQGAKTGWIDTIWSLALGLAGVAVAVVPVEGWQGDAQRRIIVAVLAAVWSIRLGSHILSRTRQDGDDPRYASLKQGWGKDWRRPLFLFLQIQAAAAFLLAATIFLAARNPAEGLWWSDIVGILVLVGAVVGEGVADSELARFRRNAANKGKVCNVGLWSVSRHPNYFFQWLGWVGYAIMAIGPHAELSWGWAALAGPAFMYWLLVHVSGIPPLEEHMMRSRGAAYARYRKQVSAFWPIPQRREVWA